MSASNLRLDDLYKMTAHIYGEQNAHRPASATFAHFVEVCGLLTIHARKKKREGVRFEDALCKALGWYFPLLAKFKVTSVEELIYRKYPYTCPYCRETPHIDAKCKNVQGTSKTVDHTAIKRKYVENSRIRPLGIDEWQQMFDKIYPRNPDDSTRSVVELFEELGELSEAIRVFDRFPKYFVGEAADVFSYLMGIANEYSLIRQQNDQSPFNFEAEYIERYPGLCVQCGYPICVCPLVPDSTVGRMAKELDIDDMQNLFTPSFEGYRGESIRIAERVLADVGGYAQLSTAFPFDRGEANRQLVLFCLQLADQVDDPAVAERLRSVALMIGRAATYSGSLRQPERLTRIVATLEPILQGNKAIVEAITGSSSLGKFVIEIITGDKILGDKYVAEQVGAQGADAQSIAPKFVLAWNQIREEVDLNQLAEELTKVGEAIAAQSKSEQSSLALTQLTEAAAGAREGNGPRVLHALSRVGEWVVDAATKIGSELTVAAVKAALGL